MTETKSMTCIICPMGCSMEVTIDSDNGISTVTKVTDNNCPRGPEYVKKELLNPTRTLTTTVTVSGGEQPIVPVKTAGEVPRSLLFQCMEVIRRSVCSAPVKRGQVIVYDLLGTGINVIACCNVDKI